MSRPGPSPVAIAGTGWRAAGARRFGVWLAQRFECRADFGGEEFGFFPGGEVAALVGLVEVGEGGIGLLDPAARGAEDLAGERGEADRDRDRRRSLVGRTSLVSSA